MLFGIGFKWIMGNQSDIKDSLKTIETDFETRLLRVEQKQPDFKSRSELAHDFDMLVSKVDHEKGNRVTSEAQIIRLIERNTDRIGANEIAIGKLESQHSDMRSTVNEIKTLISEQRKETNEKLDKMADCLNSIARKVS